MSGKNQTFSYIEIDTNTSTAIGQELISIQARSRSRYSYDL